MTDLRSQLTAQADYLEHGGDHTGIPATVETDSDVWRESIRLLRAAADELEHALQAEAPNRIPFGQVVLKAQTLAKRIRSGLVEPEAVHLRSYEGMMDALVEFAVEVLELDGREARAQEEGSTREDLR